MGAAIDKMKIEQSIIVAASNPFTTLKYLLPTLEARYEAANRCIKYNDGSEASEELQKIVIHYNGQLAAILGINLISEP